MSYLNRERVLLEIFANILLSNDHFASSLSNRENQLNLLLLGKTGHGKSATGNSTLGRREFRSSSSASSVTSEVTCSQGECQGFVINIIDTPGLADTTFQNCRVEEMNTVIENMKEAMQMSPGGVHAFLFVVKFGNRFTEEDKSCLDAFRHIFGPTFLERNGIVVFTHGDLFQQCMEEEETPDRSFGEWCQVQRGALGDLMKECEYRCFLFNNVQRDIAAKQQQLQNVVQQIRVFERPYTCLDFQLHSRLRKEFIINLKLPKLKEEFQREIDGLDSWICLLATVENADFSQALQKIDQITRRIACEDGGAGLLNDMQMQLSSARQRISRHIQIQSERRDQENNSGCSIL